jgi:hypothetical protein
VVCRDDCRRRFCAWCFAPFPAGRRGDAACHAHVRGCARNTAPGRDVIGGPNAEALFTASLREHRTRKLNELLAAQPAHMRAPLLAALARDLEDLGMSAAESVAARVRGKKRGVVVDIM